MPPKDNLGASSNFQPLKVGIDPVFGGNEKTTATRPEPNSPYASDIYNVLSNQKYVGDTTKTTTSSLPHNTKSSIHTFKDDIQDAIQTSHLSSINIAIAENERLHRDPNTKNNTDSPEDGDKNKKIVMISLVIIVFSILTIIIAFIIKNYRVTSVVEQKNIPSLITTDYRDELNIDSIVKERFNSAVSSRINDVLVPLNNIYNVYITTGKDSTKKIISSTEFVSLAGLQIPDILKRNLADDFMVGMYSFGQNLPFIIFKTTSFENTYAGMLDWEKDLKKDFGVLFRLNGEITGLENILKPSKPYKFEDATVANQDVRLLKDDNGKIIFVYSILWKDTIVLTTSDVALKEIINRLNKEKSLKR
jgi:hypothetical protein